MHAVVARSTLHVEVKMLKTHVDVQISFCVAGARDCALVKSEQNVSSSFKNDGRRGTFEEDLARYVFRHRRSTRDMFIRDVGRSGR